MKKKFTLFIALALIFSAISAQERASMNSIKGKIQPSVEQGASLYRLQPSSVNGTVSSKINSTSTTNPVFRASTAFFEDFNASTSLPAGWQNIKVTGTTGTWAISNASPIDGNNVFRADVNEAGETWLITPQITVPATGTVVLGFMSRTGYPTYYTGGGQGGNGYSRVWISTTTSDRTSFSQLYTLQYPADVQDAWQQLNIPLSDYAGQDIYLAFVYSGTYAHNWRIDNVSVAEVPDNALMVTGGYPYTVEPVNQPLPPTLSATVKNVGLQPQTNIVLTVKMNGTEIGTSSPLASLAPNATTTLTANIDEGLMLSPGENVFTLSVTQNETDPTNLDATSIVEGSVLPRTFATDMGEDNLTTYWGSATANTTFGLIYTFTKETTINQVEAVFLGVGATNNQNLTLSIFDMTGTTTTASTARYTTTFAKPTITANYYSLYNIPLPVAQTLPAGRYFVSFTETTANRNMGLLGTNADAGRVTAYSKSGTTLTASSGATPYLRLIVDVPQNDIAVVPTTGFPYAQIPQSIAATLPFPTTLTATAINNGTLAQSNITFSAAYNGADMGTSTPPIATLAAGATSAEMTVTPPAGTAFPTTLGTNDVAYTVAQTETDANSGDNSVTRHFDITKDIYALDNVPSTITSTGVGYGGGTPSGLGYKVGNVFTISAPVTLKQVQIGYGVGATATDHLLVLYKATLSGSTYSAIATDLFTPITVARPAGGGWLTIDVPPTELEPGSYFLGVQSTANDNHAVSFDTTYGNTIYLAGTGAAGSTLSLISQTGSFGAGAIRMVLDNAVYDAQLTSAVYPYSQVPVSQLFTPQTLTATAKNVGDGTLSDVKLTVDLNGTAFPSSTPVASLDPAATTNLTVDASSGAIVMGTNTLTYTVSHSKTDATPEDNTKTSTFTGTPSTFSTNNWTNGYWNNNATWIWGNIYTFTKSTRVDQVLMKFYNGATTGGTYTIQIYNTTGAASIEDTPFYTSAELTRPNTTVDVTYTLPEELTLPAGSYYFCVAGTGIVSQITRDNNTVGRIGYQKLSTTGAFTALATAVNLNLTVDAAENDLQIVPNAFAFTQLPAAQAAAMPFPALSAKATNAGAAAQTNVQFSASLDGTSLGTSTPIASIAAFTTSADMTITPSAALPTALNTYSLEYTVGGDQTDDNPGDNTQTQTFAITDNTYAIDNCTNWATGIGSTTVGAEMGNKFTISALATLKKVQVAFSNNATLVSQDYTIVLYKMTDATHTEQNPIMTSDVFTRPAGSDIATGQVFEWDVPSTDLAPGNYFLAVKQGAAANIGILADYVTGRPLLFRSAPATEGGTVNVLSPQAAMGSAYIRMVLDALAEYVDMEVVSITSPTSGNDLTDAEPVTVQLKNNGNVSATGFTLNLKVDGADVATETYSGTIASLGQAEYTFTAKANLLAGGLHEVTVTVAIANDEVADNDSKTVSINNTITSLPEVAAVKMNVYENAKGLIQVVSPDQIKEVAVYNLQGALVYKESSIKGVSHTINRGLPVGVYVVKVISEKNTGNFKLIVK